MSDRIKEIRERVEKATSGPWETHESLDVYVTDRFDNRLATVDSWPIQDEPDVEPIENAEFIAHAREDVPYLLDLLAAKDAELAEINKRMERMQDKSLLQTSVLMSLKRNCYKHFQGDEACQCESIEKALSAPIDEPASQPGGPK